MQQQEQKLQNMHHDSLAYQFLKKLIQMAIFFSILSILFLHPSWQLFFHSFISNVSTFSSHLFSLATDKNYIFLLCNGILVFVAKYSSHSVDTRPPHQPETSPDNELISMAYSQSMQSSLIEKSVMVENNDSNNEDEYENESRVNAVLLEDDVEDKYVVYQITDVTVMETEIANEEEDDDDHGHEDAGKEFIKREFDGWSYEEQVEEENMDDKGLEEEMEEEGEEEEEEAIAKMSTEELNRKFDDFIRRMKQELRIEAQRQVIVI